MTDNKFIDAFKRMLTMTLALIMVLGTVIPISTQETATFGGKKGSKYTVYDKNGAAAGTLTMKANGESNTIDLMEGSYTVRI